MKIESTRALVTGGGSGIGLAIATELARRGAKVAICGRDAQRLETAARASGALAIACDVSREDRVRLFVERATAELGGLDLAVNNAAIGAFAPLIDASAEDFEAVWRANTLGAFLVARECAKRFVAQKSGTLVNVGSTAARRGFAGGSAYCASKFALAGLTECWRAELRTSNVRVIQIDPSEVQTEFGSRHSQKGTVDPKKLVAQDVAQLLIALLELPDRAFPPSVELWATNPR
jgi:3-oxoacyl-[acyl-carrier protein] reductase